MQDSLEVLDRQRWLFENMLLMPKYEVWVKRSISVARVAGTTAIEGEGIGIEAVSDLMKGGAAGRSDGDAVRANSNAIAAYEFIDYLSGQLDIPLNELVIRELNRQFMRGGPELLTPGVYRKGQNSVGKFMPPNQGDVPALMRHFTEWLCADDDVHPVIRAGVAHVHLVSIHPFWDGNGRTARGLMTLLLQRSPFGFRNLLSVESWFADRRDAYIDAIERAQGRIFSETYDMTTWLEFFIDALAASAQSLINGLTDWRRWMQDVQSSLRQAGLNERQADGLAYAARAGRITRPEYIEIAGVSPITATRDLARLVETGFLEVQGRTRGRAYLFRKPV